MSCVLGSRTSTEVGRSRTAQASVTTEKMKRRHLGGSGLQSVLQMWISCMHLHQVMWDSSEIT